MCVAIFSTSLSEIFLIVRRIERDIIKMCICVRAKYPLFLLDCNETWLLSTDFQKKKNSDIKFYVNPSRGS